VIEYKFSLIRDQRNTLLTALTLYFALAMALQQPVLSNESIDQTCENKATRYQDDKDQFTKFMKRCKTILYINSLGHSKGQSEKAEEIQWKEAQSKADSLWKEEKKDYISAHKARKSGIRNLYEVQKKEMPENASTFRKERDDAIYRESMQYDRDLSKGESTYVAWREKSVQARKEFKDALDTEFTKTVEKIYNGTYIEMPEAPPPDYGSPDFNSENLLELFE